MKLKLLGLMMGVVGASANTFALQELTDIELSQAEAQALMSLSYIAPNDAKNLEKLRDSSSNIGFYKLGMEAELELNVNIKKLQLGCGGINGAGACDIDIDNLSLSGPTEAQMVNGVAVMATRADRASSSAKLTNPFIEFAVKNPTSASQREIVGLRLSAEKAMGLLTTGTDNGNTANGINVLSGYMQIQSDASAPIIKGKLDTKPGYLDAGWFWNNRTNRMNNAASAPNLCNGTACRYDDGSDIEPLKGSMNAAGIASSNFAVTGGGFWIPGVSDVSFTAPLTSLRGMRTDGSFTTSTGKVNGNRIVGMQIVPNTVVLPTAYLGYNPGSDKLNNDMSCGLLATSCNQFGVTSGFAPPSVYGPAGTTNFTGTKVTHPQAFQPATDILKTQGGPVYAVAYDCNALGFVPCSLLGIQNWTTQLTAKMFGKITGLKADVTFEEKLGFIHSLNVNSGASLSLQKQNLLWPGQPTDDVAQPGWWLSMKDPVYVGDLLPTNPVDLCPGGMTSVARCAYPQFVKQANQFFANNVAEVADLGEMLTRQSALGVLIHDPSVANGVALQGFSLTIADLALSTQNFEPNCWGNLKFC